MDRKRRGFLLFTRSPSLPMASFTVSITELVQSLPAHNHRLLVNRYGSLGRNSSKITSPYCKAPMTSCPNRSNNSAHVSCTEKLETLPVEIVNRILSYLIYPHCRLPGLTEAQSHYGFTEKQKRSVRNQEDLTWPADTNRWAADIFSLCMVSHPFNNLALTSRTCHGLVESYCAHLVRQCNSTMFNLPFAHLDKYGPNCVYPDLSGIVYRRLWLQHSPRKCVYCQVTLDCYPFSRVHRLFTACEGCFYRQAMTIDEVQRQYHLSPATISASHRIRGNKSPWVLRVDVEALALQLYRTREFHDARPEQFDKPCLICAITTFTDHRGSKKRQTNQKIAVRQAATKTKMRLMQP